MYDSETGEEVGCKYGLRYTIQKLDYTKSMKYRSAACSCNLQYSADSLVQVLDPQLHWCSALCCPSHPSPSPSVHCRPALFLTCATSACVRRVARMRALMAAANSQDPTALPQDEVDGEALAYIAKQVHAVPVLPLSHWRSSLQDLDTCFIPTRGNGCLPSQLSFFALSVALCCWRRSVVVADALSLATHMRRI